MGSRLIFSKLRGSIMTVTQTGKAAAVQTGCIPMLLCRLCGLVQIVAGSVVYPVPVLFLSIGTWVRNAT
ncbi:hypothetical protein ADU59_08190 [Pararhizobium polonicum]|uniref:Uncharacterized protein n=1 Tax=Pararhizobium polonicum TaxID=1612624 RepID=A0A1C7P548_9HYPH|nr:hypothetical protein ADU59_08190 [Pararhizobium polonicum]